MPINRAALGRNSKARGKQEERNVLALLKEHFGEDFKRNPDNGTKVADVESDTKVVEVKSRLTKSYALLLTAWAQAEAASQQTGKEPWLVFSFKDDGKRTRWVITKLTEKETNK